MNRKQVIFVILLVCVTGLFFFGKVRGEDEGETTSSKTQPELEASVTRRHKDDTRQRRDGSVDTKINGFKRLVANIAKPQKGPGISDVEDATPFQDLTEEEQKLGIAQYEALKDLFWEKSPSELALMLSEEEKDTNWENSIRDAATKILDGDKYPGTKLYELNCGTTLCKMVVIHDNPETQKSFSDSGFPEEEPWMGDQYGGNVEFPNGAKGNYMYFVQKGQGQRFVDLKRRLLKRYTDVPLRSELAANQRSID